MATGRIDPAADALFRQAVALAAEGDVTFAAAAYGAAPPLDPVAASALDRALRYALDIRW